MSIQFRIDVRCDRCSEVYTHQGDSKNDMPPEHRILPDDWGRVSDSQYRQIDLCVKCHVAFSKFMNGQ